MQLGLAAWHRAMLAGCPEDLLTELLADDAVFHSPVLHTPQVGREAVALHLSAACRILALGRFAYVRELADGPEAALEFEATLDGVGMNGVHLLRGGGGEQVPHRGAVREARADETAEGGVVARSAADDDRDPAGRGAGGADDASRDAAHVAGVRRHEAVDHLVGEVGRIVPQPRHRALRPVAACARVLWSGSTVTPGRSVRRRAAAHPSIF